MYNATYFIINNVLLYIYCVCYINTTVVGNPFATLLTIQKALYDKT